MQTLIAPFSLFVFGLENQVILWHTFTIPLRIYGRAYNLAHIMRYTSYTWAHIMLFGHWEEEGAIMKAAVAALVRDRASLV